MPEASGRFAFVENIPIHGTLVRHVHSLTIDRALRLALIGMIMSAQFFARHIGGRSAQYRVHTDGHIGRARDRPGGRVSHIGTLGRDGATFARGRIFRHVADDRKLE